MTNSDDCPPKPNDEIALADDKLALELLADLDLGDAAYGSDSPALKAVMAKQEQRRRKPKLSTKPSAVAERRVYEIEKAAAGKGPVRPYGNPGIAPQGPLESPDDYRRRYQREWARNKRGVTAEDIEAREYIREATTAEDKKKKKAAAERARRANMTREQKDAEAARKQRERDEAARKVNGGSRAT